MMLLQNGFIGGVMLALLITITACSNATPPQTQNAQPQAQAAIEQASESAEVTQPPSEVKADLAGIKNYLLEKTGKLKEATTKLKRVSDKYYDMAKVANFDYAALWANQKDEVVKTIEAGRATWVAASPMYEQMEGIVAGTPSLAQYDVDMDAGAAASEDPEGAVSFDITLPDGRTLAKPGNLFGVTESTLWVTFDEFKIKNIEADFNGNGQLEFGEALPDANVLKGSVDLLDSKAGELQTSAQAWQPTESDAFTALVVMVPTMSEYFNSWKDSRFVAGEKSTQRDFVAISRLSDIQDILGSLQVTYQGVSPMVKNVDTKQDAQIEQSLTDLKTFVADVHTKEQGGKRYTAEEADLLGTEAQNRATAITGQISQVAGQLGVELQN